MILKPIGGKLKGYGGGGADCSCSRIGCLKKALLLLTKPALSLHRCVVMFVCFTGVCGCVTAAV